MSKEKGTVVYSISIIYKLTNDDSVEKIIGEIENTIDIEGNEYTFSSYIKLPYLYTEITVDDTYLSECLYMVNKLKDFFIRDRIVCIDTRYILKSDEVKVLDYFYG